MKKDLNMRVLLTGASGYIGRRLKAKLNEEKDITLRLLSRNKKSFSPRTIETTEIVEGDAFDKDVLKKALSGVDVAYYFLHSLSESDYKEKDKILAQSFVDVAAECGVKRIIYLGGLGVKNEHTSKHLLSRIETGEILSSNPKVQTLWFRAGVVIGSGSSSFEIIRNLTEKLPIMTTPKWVSTMAQPIAIDDVVSYLCAGLRLENEENLVIDIGTKAQSYRDMMLDTAKALGLKRILIPVPFMSINISSYWLILFTPVSFAVAKELIEGLKSEVVIQNDLAKKYFPQIKPMDYISAVKKAVKEIEHNQVISRWNDTSGHIWEKDHSRALETALFVDRKERDLNGLSHDAVYKSFTSVGGDNGWFHYDFLWEMRGWIDKLLGGVGLQRGRRDACDLRMGDCLDFWKVVDIQKDERLLLYAQMLIPGNAWLEFRIKDDKLIQSAYFYPRGVWGRLYWYILIPIHHFVFSSLADSILKKAKENS